MEHRRTGRFTESHDLRPVLRPDLSRRAHRTIGRGAADAAREWQAYYSTWTAWNHLRTSTGVIAAVLMVAGLRYR
jgi:hypothetical protein